MLVSWPDENDALSVVSSRRISEPLVEGESCVVTEGTKKHSARVHATGIIYLCIIIHVSTSLGMYCTHLYIIYT